MTRFHDGHGFFDPASSPKQTRHLAEEAGEGEREGGGEEASAEGAADAARAGRGHVRRAEQ